MKTVLVILMLTVAGCSVSVLPHEIVKAQEFCKDHGGIQILKPTTVFGLADARWTSVRCIDGTATTLDVRS